MPKPAYIELGFGKHREQIPVLYEDRSVMAVDKPRGWMLVPFSWQKTDRNLQAAISSSIAAGDFWARSRNLKFLRYIHRLDADTTGILLFAKSQGALETFSEMFEQRQMEKIYFAVVEGIPKETDWNCSLKIAPEPDRYGKMKVDAQAGREAETYFHLLQTRSNWSLVEARPITGRTHQIRIHLAATGLPVVGDPIYGKIKAYKAGQKPPSLALRAIRLAFKNPFTRRPVEINAPTKAFLREYAFNLPKPETSKPDAPGADQTAK